MRFAIALLTLLIAGVLVAAGIAQRTVWKPADSVSAAFSVPKDARYVVIPGSVLHSHPGEQHLHIEGDGVAFAAYGKTADVTAWLSGERYAELGTNGSGTPVAATMRTAPTVAGLTGGGAPNPDGSDLWIDQHRGQRTIEWTVNVPESVSMIVAADGSAAAPSSIRLAWPVATGTPLAVPMIAAGAVLAVVGLLLYIWALVQLRRRRGPRRKSPPKRPQPPRYRPVKQPVITSTRGRRSVSHFTATRVVGGTGLLLAGAVVLAGWGSTPAVAATPAPTASRAAVVPAAVTEQQAERIVHAVAAVSAAADKKLDAEALLTRFGGPALALRQTAYVIHKANKKTRLPQAVPAVGAFRLIVPERTASWPRTLFTVVTDGSSSTVPPLALAMVQNDPRSDYKVQYAMSLEPKAALPTLPSAVLGASRLASDTPVLRVAPDHIGAAYGVLLRKPDATAAQIFDVASDDLVGSVGAKAKAKAAKALGSTAKISFSTLASDPAEVIALSTANAGALVAVNLDEQWTVKPKHAGVTVTPSGGTRILSKTGATSKGIASVYGYQLLFSVPSAGSQKPVVLLGYAQGLVSAKEL